VARPFRRREQPAAPAPVQTSPTPAAARPDPQATNNYIIVILDSCRYDSFMAAEPASIRHLGEVERRWSYASWTLPSHHNLLAGLLPHASPTGVYASDYYKQDFLRYDERLGAQGIEFRRMLPQLFLPSFLKHGLGYETSAMVSMPVLNPRTVLNTDFDRFELMPSHNDMRAMVEKLSFSNDRPTFHLLNVGETHYPYALPDEDPSEWPRISGLHGVVKHLDRESDDEEPAPFFSEDELTRLQRRQVDAVRYLDGVIGDLLDAVPKDTYITITADHGELFGEGGYFGHGPINHEKVFEVPFVEGKVR
jgi:hypothetical protein